MDGYGYDPYYAGYGYDDGYGYGGGYGYDGGYGYGGGCYIVRQQVWGPYGPDHPARSGLQLSLTQYDCDVPAHSRAGTSASHRAIGTAIALFR